MPLRAVRLILEGITVLGIAKFVGVDPRAIPFFIRIVPVALDAIQSHLPVKRHAFALCGSSMQDTALVYETGRTREGSR